MVFSSPWLLWALLAASLPVLIHLANLWRHRSVQWAAMEFLRRANRESRSSKKLLHYLVLVLRTLAVIFLVLAFTRPLVSSFLGLSSSGINHVLLVFDRSASMSNRPNGVDSLRDQVAPLVSEALSSMPGTRLTLLDSVTGQCLEVSSPDVLGQLSVTEETESSADIPALLEHAATFLKDSDAGQSEIWIASDMQLSDWHADSPRWAAVRSELSSLPQPPTIRCLSLRQRPDGNRALHIQDARIVSGKLLLDFSIECSGNTASADDPSAQSNTEKLPLVLSLGRSTSEFTVELSGANNRFFREIALPEGVNSGYGSLSMPHDRFAADDTAFFVFSPDPVAQVEVVAQTTPTAQILSRMAAPPTLAQTEAHVTMLPVKSAPDWSSKSLVIWQGPLPNKTTADALASWVASGGSLLFLPPEHIPANLEQRSFLNLSWGETNTAESDQIFSLNAWDHSSGLLQDSRNQSLPVQLVRAIRRTPILGKGIVDATWSDSSPALVRLHHGQGEFCFLSTLPNYTWSNLADGHILLPLIHRLTHKGNERLAPALSLPVGAETSPTSGDGSPVQVVDALSPADSPQRAASLPLKNAGVFRLDDTLFCTNTPEPESDPRQVSPEQLTSLFGSLHVSDLGVDDDSALTTEISTPLLLAAIICFLAEALLLLPPSSLGSSNPKPSRDRS